MELEWQSKKCKWKQQRVATFTFQIVKGCLKSQCWHSLRVTPHGWELTSTQPLWMTASPQVSRGLTFFWKTLVSAITFLGFSSKGNIRHAHKIMDTMCTAVLLLTFLLIIMHNTWYKVTILIHNTKFKECKVNRVKTNSPSHPVLSSVSLLWRSNQLFISLSRGTLYTCQNIHILVLIILLTYLSLYLEVDSSLLYVPFVSRFPHLTCLRKSSIFSRQHSAEAKSIIFGFERTLLFIRQVS